MTMMNRKASTILWALLLIVQAFWCDAFQATPLSSPILDRPHTGSFIKLTPRSSPTWKGITSQASSTKLQALPTCVASNVHTVALVAGGTGLVCQAALTKFFEQSELFQKHAAYTAHNVIALALMLVVSGIGIAGWWGMDTPLTAVGRLMGSTEGSADACRWLASIVTGLILFWDVPVSLAIPALRKPDVIVHHVAMAAVAYVGAAYLPMYYLFFYLGVSEISSIPVIVYDQLTVLSTDEEVDGSLAAVSETSARITALRDQVQIVAAVSFTMIRAILFTMVTVSQFVPDVLSVLPAGGNALRFGGVASMGFTALQLFWFSKMVGVMVNGEEKTTPGEETNELVAAD